MKGGGGVESGNSPLEADKSYALNLLFFLFRSQSQSVAPGYTLLWMLSGPTSVIPGVADALHVSCAMGVLFAFANTQIRKLPNLVLARENHGKFTF